MWNKALRVGLATAVTATLLLTGSASGAPAHVVAGGPLDQITAAGMPGVFAVTRDWSAASGVSDVDTGSPVRPWYSHRVGSITKTFTAVTLLQLVGERRVSLDAPVSRYLPQYQTPGVTVRMLLNHTSGIGDFDTVLIQSADDLLALQHTTYQPDTLVRLGLGAPRTNAPGAMWSYSNTNYLLAGLIIEKVTGHPAVFEAYRRIIVPLGLWHTYFAGSTSRIIGPHMEANIPWLDGKLRDFSVFNMSWAWMLGDAVSTGQDLNRFYDALLNGRLLRPAELAQMQTTVPFDASVPEAGGYGLGIYFLAFPCGNVWGHDGLVFGHSTISLHTAHAERQITIAENMTHYIEPGRPDPIAAATADVLVSALCPGTSAGTRSLTRPQWRSPLPARKF